MPTRFLRHDPLIVLGKRLLPWEGRVKSETGHGGKRKEGKGKEEALGAFLNS